MGDFGIVLLSVLRKVLGIYTYVILADAILSWGILPPSNPIVRVVRFLAEPILNPCRRILRRIIPPGRIPFDFSPLLAMLLIQAVSYVIGRVMVYLILG